MESKKSKKDAPWSGHTTVWFIILDAWIGSVLIWMFSTWGLGPVTGIIGVFLSLVILSTIFGADEEDGRRKLARRVRMKQSIGQLEAEAGIPLIEEGECPKCGWKLVAGAKFCSNCGRSTEVKAKLCQNCGARNQDFALFCHECGKELMPQSVSQ